MGATDLILATAILAGAGWLLYRSLWRGQGHCHGCSGACGSRSRRTEPLVRLGARRSRERTTLGDVR